MWRKRRLFGAPVAFENADFGDKAVEHIASSGDPEKPPVKILEQDKAVQVRSLTCKLVWCYTFFTVIMWLSDE